MLFTLITDRDGSTFVDQVTAGDPLDAIIQWNQMTEAGASFRADDMTEDNGPTPVQARTSVWCFSGIDENDQFFLVHIIDTRPQDI